MYLSNHRRACNSFWSCNATMRNNSTVNTVVREQYSIRASKDPARTTSSMSAATTETTSSSTATEMDAAWKITTISTWIGFPRPSLVVYEESIDAAMTITFSTLATYESSISTPDTSTLTSISRSPPTAGLLSISSTSLAGTVSTTAPSRTSSDPLGTPSLTPSSTTIQATSSASPTDAVSIPISNHVSTRRISRAAFAGGLIGAAVAAALLTALIIICCHRSRRARRSTETPNDTYPVDWFTSQNRPPVGRYEKPLAHPNRAWEPLLPQSADDRTIQVAIKTLFDKLEVHVENFYTPRHVHITSDRHRNLAAVDSGLLSESLDRVMADTLSPLNLIKHWIAYFVTYMMSPGNGELSLLPKEYSNLPAGLANMNVCTPQSNGKSPSASSEMQGIDQDTSGLASVQLVVCLDSLSSSNVQNSRTARPRSKPGRYEWRLAAF